MVGLAEFDVCSDVRRDGTGFRGNLCEGVHSDGCVTGIYRIVRSTTVGCSSRLGPVDYSDQWWTK